MAKTSTKPVTKPMAVQNTFGAPKAGKMTGRDALARPKGVGSKPKPTNNAK